MKKIELHNFLKQHLDRAGFTGLDIVKTPLVTRIVLHVARPGLAIGKGGQNIKQLTEDIGTKFGIENPQIEIQDIKHPELDATATVDRMVGLLQRGYSWRSVSFNVVRTVMNSGAQGIELILSGKLSGKGGRNRKTRIAQGYMKKVGDQVKLVDYAKASAYPKAGAIGIKLRIIHPDTVFPDKINIKELLEKREMAAAQEKEAAVAAEKAAKEKEEEKAKEAEKAEKEKTEKAEEAEKAEKKEKEKEAGKEEKSAEKEKAEKKPKEKKEQGEKKKEKAGKEEKATARKTEKKEEKEKEIEKAGKEKTEKAEERKEKQAEKKEEEKEAEKVSAE